MKKQKTQPKGEETPGEMPGEMPDQAQPQGENVINSVSRKLKEIETAENSKAIAWRTYGYQGLSCISVVFENGKKKVFSL